jgi:AmmeMemoRadiSam system protein B
MYSGPVAASAFYELAQDGKPDTVVLLGPGHTRYGGVLSIMREGQWQTPLGNVEIDTAIADVILHETPLLDIDELAHRYEHSLEVQLPFLQFLYGNNFKIVPIVIKLDDYEVAAEIGNALLEALDATNSLVIASSDMTHYEPANVADAKDHAALKKVTDLEAKGFFDIIQNQDISACGYMPITSLITYAVGVNAKAELLSYHNSGEVSGDPDVVGYASVVFKK